MLTKQTKQSQRHQESLPLPVGVILVASLTRSALCLNPVLGLGVGGLQPGQRRGSLAHRPQAVPSDMSAISSPPSFPPPL